MRKSLPMDAELPDPRVRTTRNDTRWQPVIERIESSLAATSAAAAAADDDAIDRAITGALDASPGDGARDDGRATLAALFDAAPSPVAYRHLWRRLTQVMSVAAPRGRDTVAVTLFAIPLVIVTGREDGESAAQLAGTLADAAAIADLLRAHDALAGIRNFALANALVQATAIDVDALPRLRVASAVAFAEGAAPLDLAPSSIVVPPGESVHLRFLVGSALTAPGVRLFDGVAVGEWAMPLAKMLGTALATEGATVLVLPRAPSSLPQALLAGKLAQREVSAQLFMTNALRRMRASVGEPTAIVSAHRLDSGDGELRLSLSSPFSPRDAEGFRCPLFAFERVGDAATMLDELLRDCRVTDVRVEPGVHGDRDPGTGLTLLFKPPSLEPDWPRRPG